MINLLSFLVLHLRFNMDSKNYKSWAKITLTVNNLKLDSNNPRIPSYYSTKTPNDILSYMFDHEEISRLAQKIADKGYIPHEPIYVIKDNDNYVVVEGNRRVSALKCLLNPEKAPTVTSRKLMRKLHKQMSSDIVEKIEVIVAPSRRDVEVILFELHAEGKKQWSRQQKNKFIAEIGTEGGESIADIASRFGVTPSEIRDSVQEFLLSKYFKNIDFPLDIEEKINQSKINMSTLSRIVNSSSFHTLTGYEIIGNRIVTSCSISYFNELIKAIITDIVENKINSRTINKSESINEYLGELEKSITHPNDGSNVDFSVSASVDLSNTEASGNNPKLKSKKKIQTLIPKGKYYNTGSGKLDYLIEEAQGIVPHMHKCAAALMLRTIIELSIIRIFEKNDQKKFCINENGRPKQLSQNIKELLKRENWFSNQAYLSDLRRFTDNDGTHWNSLETLNRYAHGEFIIPDKDMLHSVWLITEPLIEMCCDPSDN